MIKILPRHNTQPFVEVSPGLRVQVLDDIPALPRCQKHQFAAFISEPPILVVWEDQPDHIVERLEAAILKTVWEHAFNQSPSTPGPEADAMEVRDVREQGKEEVACLESGEVKKPRKVVLIWSILSAVTLALVIASIAGGWRQIALEVAVDEYYLRIAFVLAFLPQAWLALVSSHHVLIFEIG